MIGLRIQCPDHRDRYDIASCKDEECVFADGCEHYGAEESEPAVANRPAYDAPGVALGTDFEGKDLWKSVIEVTSSTVMNAPPQGTATVL